MTTDNRNDSVYRVTACNASDETGGTDDIESGDTKDTSGVEDTLLLEGGGNDGNGGVYGVRDNENVGFRSDAGNSGGEVTDNGSVGLAKTLELAAQNYMAVYSR